MSLKQLVQQAIDQRWQLRCPKCGRSKPLDEVGGIRIGAWSLRKRVLARCSQCRRLRWVVVERITD